MFHSADQGRKEEKGEVGPNVACIMLLQNVLSSVFDNSERRAIALLSAWHVVASSTHAERHTVRDRMQSQDT